MAATLAEIKSRMLLPVMPTDSEEILEDPRLELVQRLQQYEQMKLASLALEDLPRAERDVFILGIQDEHSLHITVHPDMTIDDLTEAYKKVLRHKQVTTHHTIERESFSVKDKMHRILEGLEDSGPRVFYTFLQPEEGQAGIIACFLAVLELGKLAVISIQQEMPFAPIFIEGIKQ